jgi:hypothetical protein
MSNIDKTRDIDSKIKTVSLDERRFVMHGATRFAKILE